MTASKFAETYCNLCSVLYDREVIDHFRLIIAQFPYVVSDAPGSGNSSLLYSQKQDNKK